jgi:hypothetical protein
MYQKYNAIAEFRMVYIKEAHPADGFWPMPIAKEKGINNHTDYADRCTTAEMLFKDKQLTIPCLIDDMDDTVNKAYAGWPDRIFVVRTDGRLAIAGEMGPRGFKPALVATEKWLAVFSESGQQPDLSPEAIEAADKRAKQAAK